VNFCQFKLQMLYCTTVVLSGCSGLNCICD